MLEDVTSNLSASQTITFKLYDTAEGKTNTGSDIAGYYIGTNPDAESNTKKNVTADKNGTYSGSETITLNGETTYYIFPYDKAGNITKVSQNVNKLSNGTVIESSFTYNSGDRLSKITHNGFNYDLGYTEFGLLESIKAGKSNLINYGYDNDGIVTSVSYGNNQIIDYELSLIHISEPTRH